MSRRFVAFVAVVCLVAATGVASARDAKSPGVQVSVVAKFPTGVGGVAATTTNDVVVTAGASVVKVGLHGQKRTFTTIPGGLFGGAIGLTYDRGHRLYAAFPTGGGSVLRISSNGKGVTPIPGSEGMNSPDGFGFDRAGRMYVTDVGGNGLWRVGAGGTAELWSVDPLLVRPHGVKVFKGAAYVSVEGGQILKIPISPDGSPRVASVWASSPGDLFDDIVVDDRTGDVYVASLNKNRVLRITPNGVVSVVATYRDGLVTPANLALIHVDKSTIIYVGNAYKPGFFPGSDPSQKGGAGRALLKLTIAGVG